MMTGRGQAVMRGQVTDHFMFEPMVQRKQHGDQDDLYAQHFPGLPMCKMMDLIIGDQDDELEEHDKGKKTKDPDHILRDPEDAHYNQRNKENRDADSDRHVLNIMIPYFFFLPFLLFFFQAMLHISRLHLCQFFFLGESL